MYQGGSVTDESLLMRQGQPHWLRAKDELKGVILKNVEATVTPPPLPVGRRHGGASAERGPHDEQMEKFNSIILWVSLGLCVVGAVPFLGLLAFCLYGFWSLCGLILCVIQINRGLVGRGIANLFLVLVVGPVTILALQFLGLLLLGSAAANSPG